VVAVSPYVYYFEGVAGGWVRPVLLSALVHELGHVAFLMGGRLRLEAARRMCLDPRLVMQLPFVNEADVKLAREVGEEVDVLMEAPALWAERLVMEELGLADHVEARLRLQEARDEALRALMEEHGLRVAGRPAKWRTARLRAHLARLEGVGVRDVVGYVEAELRRLLKGLYEKLEEGLEVVVKDAAVEAPAVMGRTVERLAAWRMFLRRGFGYAEP